MQDILNTQNILFSQCCNDWLRQKEYSIKVSSYYNYKFAIEKHISPILGEKTLAELEKYDFNEFIRHEKSLIQNTQNTNNNNLEEIDDLDLKSIITKLKSILNYTTKKYCIMFDLEAFSVTSSNPNEVDVFKDYESRKLTKYLVSSNILKNIGVLICLYSGLRIGEICGLKWCDIDLEEEVINVNRTIQRIYLGKNDPEKTRLLISKPKTKKSKRKIPISKVILKKLKDLKSQYPKDAFVLTGKTNKFYEPSSYRYDYKIILQKCKIPYRKFHALRHTFSTNCIKVGMDVKSLSEVLGHSSIGITMNLYVHSNNEIKKKYINRL